MQKKFNLKAFNLYEYLKHQNAQDPGMLFFLADRHTYEKAHVNFLFRTFAYGIGITYSGQEDVFKIGSTDYVVGAGCLTTVGPGMVCQWSGHYISEHDTVYFTEELFREMSSVSFLQGLPFFFHGGRHVIRLTDDQVEKMAALFRLLKELKEEKRAVPGLVYSLLRLAESFHTPLQGPSGNPQVTNREKIASNFRKLVAGNFPEHKEVAFYADKLNITPKYLSEVLQAELGKSAKTFIDEHVAMEAKSLLKQTTFSIQEICHWLGFEDASHFARAFKKATHLTPTEYRKG